MFMIMDLLRVLFLAQGQSLNESLNRMEIILRPKRHRFHKGQPLCEWIFESGE